MEQPLISVIMPAYNCEAFIRQAIDSVLNQSHRNLELLIADDHSTDHSRKIIDSYTDPRIVRHHNSSNLGYLKTCNKLFALCKGKYITFQDADDLSAPNRLELQLQTLLDRNIPVVGTNLIAIDTKGNELFCSHYRLEKEEVLAEIRKEYFPVIPNSFLFEAGVLQQVGGYNPYFDRIGAEDYYWTWLILEKYSFCNLQKPLYYYRLNPNSISGNLSDNHKKLLSGSILSFLIRQRLETQTDFLEQQEQGKLDAYVKTLEKPYTEDPSYFYNTLAAKYFYEGNKARAIRLSLRAFLGSPFKLQNLKNLLYFIRKSI